MMIIKAFGYNTNAQALSFVGDLKLGHYAKLPPRAVFKAQVLATLVSGFVTIFVANWQIDHSDSICQAYQTDRFTCPGETTYFSASIVWGVIGPKRVFSNDGLYPILKYCFLIGCFVPVPFFLLDRYAKISLFKFLNPLVILAGMTSYAPYSLAFYTTGLYVSYISHRVVRKKYPTLWNNFNYILACALDSGVALAAIVIFFALNYTGIELSWWGNNVSTRGYDGGKGRMALKPLKDGGTFGPAVFHENDAAH
jgi:OPT family oligopeptide transporter